MSERWVDEIRKLRTLDVPDEVWDRALKGSTGVPERRPARRWIAAAVAAVVFLGGGTVAWLAFGPREHRDPVTVPPGPTSTASTLPDVARIVCGEGRPSTTTPVVRPQRDGVHVVISNRGGFTQVFFPDPFESVGSGHGGRLLPGRNVEITYAGPGVFEVGCFHGAVDWVGHSAYVEVRVVDPQGLFTPDQPQCSVYLRHRGIYRRIGSASDLEAIVRTIPGVLPDDEIRRPGYSKTPWIVEPRVVIRSGRVIAHVTMYGPGPASPPANGSQWRLVVDACPDTGIGAPTG